MQSPPWHVVVLVIAIVVLAFVSKSSSSIIASTGEQMSSTEDPKEETFLVPSRDILPYVQITRDMVKEVPKSKLPNPGLQNPVAGSAVIDRYSLERLPSGHGISDEQLGPSLAENALRGARVTSVGIVNGEMLESTGRGRSVTLGFSPPSVEDEPLVLTNTIVLDWEQGADPARAVVVVPPEDVAKFTQYAAAAKAMIFR